MKCARVRFTWEMVVPYAYVQNGEASEWDDHGVDFDVNENSCFWCGRVGSAFDNVVEAHEPPEGSRGGTCVGCALQGWEGSLDKLGNELIEIIDLTPNHPLYAEAVNRQGDWLAKEIEKFHAVKK